MRRAVTAFAFVAGLATVLATVSCDTTTTAPGHVFVSTDSTGTLTIVGDPEAPGGASWGFHGVANGVTYDLAGVLLKPAGAGPFPAVLLSHGSEGNGAYFANLVGPTMVSWGLVCIAPNYTHSTGVAIGAPGDASQPGASAANILRAHMTRELLKRLSYVDTTRIAAHGHSMGAYLEVATAGAYPNDFRVASTTGGGVRPPPITIGPAPSPTQASTIITPFQMHHGDADATVQLAYDQRFDSLLTAHSVEHQLWVYPGEDHLPVRTDANMFVRVHDWYTAHGIF